MTRLWMCVVGVICLAVSESPCATISVDWTGAGDYVTIAEGLAASGVADTVVVSSGIYNEYDLEIGHNLVLRSATLDPESVTIDAQGLGKICQIHDIDRSCVVEGITFTGGYESYVHGTGGALNIGNGAPIVRCCVFEDNRSEGYAGAVHALNGSYFEDCVFENNSAVMGAAAYCYGESEFLRCLFVGNSGHEDLALYLDYADARVESCTFAGNTSPLGGGPVLLCNGTATVLSSTFTGNQSASNGTIANLDGIVTCSQSVMAFNSGASFGASYGGSFSLSCCDVYENEAGDWPECVADQYGIDGNFSGDPLFCGDLNPTYPWSLHTASPCAPGSSPCGEQIGAWGVGCGAVSIESATWSSVKALFR